MKKTTIISVAFLCLCCTLQAQDFKSAVGAKLGAPLAISLKHFFSENMAVDLYAGTQGRHYNAYYWDYYDRYDYRYGYRWWTVGANLQYHRPIEINYDLLGNFSYYFGGGAAAYFWNWDYGYYHSDRYSKMSVGIQACGGINYTFDDYPVNVTIEWAPTVFINGFGSGLRAGYGSVGVRYVLNRG
ncbi:MAG: hypothetical protein H6577_16065 [Lewinellaceae bacterium]|nr:hypothetical protein [Saprospiraceae bacterium]MCB9339644.1 hypothetical protein [Lewinellaceae bacterium]